MKKYSRKVRENNIRWSIESGMTFVFVRDGGHKIYNRDSGPVDEVVAKVLELEEAEGPKKKPC